MIHTSKTKQKSTLFTEQRRGAINRRASRIISRHEHCLPQRVPRQVVESATSQLARGRLGTLCKTGCKLIFRTRSFMRGKLIGRIFPRSACRVASRVCFHPRYGEVMRVVHRQEDIPDPLDELKSLSEGMKDSKIHV